MSIPDSVVFITGASSGIGRALAVEYARRGARVAAVARRIDALQDLAGTEKGILPVRADVNVDGDSEKAVEATLSAYGRIDTVVANAGFGVQGLFQDLTIADYKRQFETNVFGVLRTARAALSALRATKGRLALMGSVNGYVPTPEWSAYVMSKYAVRGMAESLEVELRASGVSVTHIAPGFIESDFRATNWKLPSGEKPAKDPIPGFLIMPVVRAAREMIDAIEARRFEAVITALGKTGVFLQRHTPGVVRPVMAFAASRMPSMKRK